MEDIKYKGSDFSDFTIIIPPHNRHTHLTRVLEYLEPFRFNIIIADSSGNAYEGDLSKYDTIHYFHLANSSFPQKIQEALKHVSTKYCMLMAEDDFYIPDTLYSCLTFLRNNPSYSSCQGLYTKFATSSNAAISTKFLYLNSFGRDLNDETSLKRIDSLLSSYIQLFYSVHTTKTLNDVFSYSAPSITNMFVIEFLIAIFSLINGKHKVLNEFYGSREYIPSSVGNTHVNFHSFSSEKKYSEQYKSILNDLSALIAKKDQISSEEAEKQLLSSINYYLNSSTQRITLPNKVKNKLAYYIKTSTIDKSFYNNNWSKIKKAIRSYPTLID